MIAVADRFDKFAGDATWQFATDAAHTVTVEDGAFTIRSAGGASLRGTVITPAGARVKSAEHSVKHEDNYWGDHHESIYRRTLITFEGAGDFLVVMTLQRGAAPRVERLADGQAQIGRQAITWDGRRVVIGPLARR